jgi:nucleotide-binding universal stress UspA family protein
MKTFIVPVDFSDTSKNAATYATRLAAGIDDSRIILLNVFDEIFAGEDGTPLYNDIEARKKIALFALEALMVTLPLGGNTRIECDAEPGTVVRNLESYARRQGADLIIMGITGSSGIDQIMIGSTTLNVVHNVSTPVMIIPPDATFKGGITNIALTSDFRNVAATTPFAAIKEFLGIFEPKLHIVHVDEGRDVEGTEAYKSEKAVLEEHLGSFNPEFHFVHANDFLEGIDDFVTHNQVDALITVPKKHTFLENLFRTKHTKRLAYHLHIPIVAIHL